MLFYPNNAAQYASNILPFGEIVGVVPSSHPTSGSSFVRWLVQRKYLIPHTTSLVNNLGDDVTDAIDNSEVDTKGGDGSGQGTQMSTCSSSIQADVTGTTTTRKRKRGDAFSDTLSSRKGNDAESQDSQVVHHVSRTDLMMTFKKICYPSNANRIASPPLSPQSSDSESESQDSQVVHHVSSTDLMITFKKICCPSNANRIASPPLSPQSSDSESSSDTGAHEGSDDSDSE